MPLPTIAETFRRRPGTISGAVAAGLGANVFPDDLQAEQAAEQQQLAQLRLANQLQQNQQREAQRIETQTQRDQIAAAKQQEKEKQDAMRQEVAKATLAKSTLPATMTREQRNKLSKDLSGKEGTLRVTAAQALRDAATSDPNAGKTTGGFLGFFGSPTPEAQEIEARMTRLEDPANLTEQDLQEARKLNPKPFEEVDQLKGTLQSDAATAEARRVADTKLARARAKAAGVPQDELDAIAPLQPDLRGTPPDQRTSPYQNAARAGALEREQADLQMHQGALQRQTQDLEAIRSRRESLRAQLQSGVRGPESAKLHGELLKLDAHEGALSETLKAETETYNGKVRALQYKQNAFNESVAAPAESTTGAGATTKPPLDVEGAKARTVPVMDQAGAVVGRATNQPDTLEALASAGEKAFWQDPQRPQATQEARVAKTKAANDSLSFLQESAAKRTQAYRTLSDRLMDRVKRGEIDPAQAQEEEDKELARYEQQHAADAEVANRHLNDALRDFHEGAIDSGTLNAVYHAAGAAQSGVEAFKERLAQLRREDEHVAALKKVIGDGAEDPGLNGQAMALTQELRTAQERAAFYHDPKNAVHPGPRGLIVDDTENFRELGKAEQTKATALAEKLNTLRQAWKSKLATELTKRGVDTADQPALIARAELDSIRSGNPGVAAVVASRGGTGAAMAEKLPFAGGVIEATRLLPYAATALKLQNGEQPSPEEMDALGEFIRFSGQDPSFVAKISDVVASLPGFAIELASTAGVATAVKGVTQEGLQKALVWAAQKEGRKAFAEVAARSAAGNVVSAWGKRNAIKHGAFRLASGAIQEAARLPMASAGRIVSHFTNDTATQAVQLTQDEGRLAAVMDHGQRHGNLHRFADAVVDSFIENMSERSGRWLTAGASKLTPQVIKTGIAKLSAPVKDRLFRGAVARALVGANPGVPMSRISGVLAKANIGGTLEEMGEERVGDVARDLWKGVSSGEWGVTLPSMEDIGVEFVSFLVPGAKSAFDVTRHFSKLDRSLKASDAESTDHIRSFSDEKATAARLSAMLKVGDGSAVQIEPDQVAAARDLLGPVETSSEVRGIDRAVANLLQRSEAAIEVGDLGKASTLRQMALEQSRTRTQAADAAMLQAIQAADEISAMREKAQQAREQAKAQAAGLAELQAQGQPVTPEQMTAPQAAEVLAAQFELEADLSSGLVKIARGRQEALTTGEKVALQSGTAPAVVDDGQGPVITDSAREQLQRIAPTAARYIKQSETQRREQLAQSGKLATQAEAQQNAGGASQTAGAAPAGSGTGTAQGAATATPAGAAPAPTSGEWSATGMKGTRVTLPAGEARTKDEATAKLAMKLPPGEAIRSGSVNSPPATAAPAQTAPTEAKPASKIENHGKGDSFDADKWATNATARIARHAGNTKAHEHLTETVTALHQQLKAVGHTFKGGIEFVPDGAGSGIMFDPERKTLGINLRNFASQTQGLTGQALDDYVQTMMHHEVIHVAADEILTPEQIKDLWKRLGKSDAGKALARDVLRGYFAAYEQRNEKPPALSNYKAGHELLRMMVEDKAFAGRISEAQGIDPGLVASLLEFLRKLSDWLNLHIKALPQADRAALESSRDNVIAALRAMGVSIAPAAEQQEEQPAEEVMAEGEAIPAMPVSTAAPVAKQKKTRTKAPAPSPTEEAAPAEEVVQEQDAAPIAEQDNGQGEDEVVFVAPPEDVATQTPAEQERPARKPRSARKPSTPKDRQEKIDEIAKALTGPASGASEATKAKARKAFEGLAAAERPTTEQTGLPRERRADFMDLADALIEDGVTQPPKLAAFLNEIAPDGRLQKYSQALWNYLGTVSPELSGTHDWAAVYADLSKPEETAAQVEADAGETTEQDANAPATSKNEVANAKPEEDTATNDTRDGPTDQSEVTPNRTGVAGSVTADGGTAELLDGPPSGDVAETDAGRSDSALSPSASADGARPDEGTGTPEQPGRSDPGTDGDSGGSDDAGGGRLGRPADAATAGVVQAAPAEQQPDRSNYVLRDPEAIVGGGPKARFERNRKALETYQDLKSSNRAPTSDELDTIAGYMGWGSFGQELFDGSWDRPKVRQGWEKEDEWLRNHLGKSEWESAQRSIINAHYTDPPTVLAMWRVLEKMGFTGGRVLEPSMGIGNFFGLMPAAMAQNSQLTGIELDELTGGMAQMLYPRANVRVMGYQNSKTADDFYDVVIGNWPFFEQGPADRRYDSIGATLHDYFFIKALDQVRPGGIVIGITSAGTMDKKGMRARAEMAKRGELVAAFRLPSGAFEKYAGTKVVTDLIILQKRDKPATSEVLQNAGWMGLTKTQTPGGEVEINEYFVKNPGHVLGRLNFGHGTTVYRAAMIVDRPDDLEQRLKDLPDLLPEGAAFRPAPTATAQSSYVTNNSNDRQGAVLEQDGGLYVVNGEHLRPLGEVVTYAVKDSRKTARREDQIRRLVGIRRALGAVLDAQRKGLENTETLRGDLKRQYQEFVKAHKAIRDSDGLNILQRANDPFAPSLAGLEYLGEDKKWHPREIFERNVMRGKPVLDSPSISDAYAMARNESLTIDIDAIAAKAKTTVEAVEAELIGNGQVFRTPVGNYEPSDVYLSGNVRQKLREALDAQAEGVQGMEPNIDALRKVLPADIPYFQIESQAGATWVPAGDYEAFARHLLNAAEDDITVARVPSGWKVLVNNDRVTHKAEAITTWGTAKINWRKLFSAVLNNATVKITYRDEDGLHTDEKATQEANAKIDAMREEFARWIWQEPERTVRLERAYNEVFNAVAIPQYDGSHLAFEGLALAKGDREFNLRKHQQDAVWRGILTGRGLYAHEVGTGKTLVMAGLAMESRRLGKARKPLILAHNANARQVAAEIQGAYPGAKVLFVDNLKAETRQATLNQIALDDWDCVVMPHSIIDRLCLRPESVEDLVREEIAELENAAMEAAEEDDADLSVSDMDDPEALKKLRSPTAKELVKEREKLKNMIEKARQMADKPDSVFFEDLGVDMIVVDEAHIFKKLPLSTKQKLKGLNKSGSKRGIILNLLTQHVKRTNGGQGVHLFTGTPVTNTLNEVFNMMRYMMDDVMKRDQVDRWDSWFNAFAASTSEVELNSAGEWDAIERLAAFVNLPELRRMVGQYLDIVFADDMPEFSPRSEREGRTEDAIGRPFKQVINEISPMTHAQKRHKEELSERYQTWKKMTGREKVKAMRRGAPEVPIIIEGEGVKAAIDMRLIDRTMPDAPEGKVGRCIRNVMKHFAEHPRATQMIFMQTGFSDYAERSTGQRTADGKPIKVRVPVFNVAKDIKRQLIEKGIPAEQIVIFSDLDADERKLAAEKMQTGEIRVAIGSTETMGTGVNAQNELRAMHHIDAPWMPGDLEQRNGRGWRQGNRWNTVLEYRYITEGSHDGRRWQILLTKDRFIKRFMKADDTMRVIEGDGVDLDEEGGGFEETFSAAAGDPRILQREKLTKDVNKLLEQQRRHVQAINQAKSTANELRRKIERIEFRLPKMEKDKAAYEENRAAPFSIKLGKTTFTDREQADSHLLDLLDTIAPDGDEHRIGTYRGFQIIVRRTPYLSHFDLRGAADHSFQSKSTAAMDYALRSISSRIEGEHRDIEESQVSLSSLARMSDMPFGRQGDLERKQAMQDDIIADLATNPTPAPAWLRNGAPAGTSVWVDGKEYGVAGHRTRNGFKIVVEGNNGEVREVDYLEVMNETGLPLFEASITDTSEEAPPAAQPPERISRQDPERLFDIDKVPRGLWRSREKLRTLLEKLEKRHEETDQEAVRIDNVQKQLAKVEGELLNAVKSGAEGGLAANERARTNDGQIHPSEIYVQNGQPDPFTRAPSLIPGRQVSAPHAAAIAGRIASYLSRAGRGTDLRERPDTVEVLRHSHAKPVGWAGAEDHRGGRSESAPARSLEADFLNRAGVPLVTLQDLGFKSTEPTSANTKLIKVGDGTEGLVFAPRPEAREEPQVAYKILTVDGQPAYGNRLDLDVDKKGKLKTTLRINEQPGELLARYFLQGAIGGTPTEIAGVTAEGYVVLKQPFATIRKPAPADIAQALRSAGAIAVPYGLLERPKETAIVAVKGVPVVVYDIHGGNIVFDTQNQPRLNDMAFAALPAAMVDQIPGLRAIVDQALAREADFTDRSRRLFAGERASSVRNDDPELRAALDALNEDLPTEAELSDLHSRAGFDWGADLTGEQEKQIAENARAAQRNFYDLKRDEQTHEGWNAAARAMIAKDPTAALRELATDAVSGTLGRNAVKVKAAQLVIPGLFVRAIANKDKQAFRDAEALTWAYDVAGTETARGLAARWKPYQLAEDAHREMLAKMIFTPGRQERERIDKAISRAEKNSRIKELEDQIEALKTRALAREREILGRAGELLADVRAEASRAKAEANRQIAELRKQLQAVLAMKDKLQLVNEANVKRLAEIESALGDMGVTLHDLFVSKEAIIRLRGSALVKNVLAGLNPRERLAVKNRLEGLSDRQIARQTGISERSLGEVFSRFDSALRQQIGTWVDRGFSLADFEMLDSACNRVDVAGLIDADGNLAAGTRAVNLTAEERAARIDGIFGAIVPASKARNSGALKRHTGTNRAGAPYGFDISRPEHAIVLARAIQRLDSSPVDMVYEYWINGLLSGPATHVANLMGNTGNASLEYLIQRPLEAITNAVLFRDAAGAQMSEYRSMAKYVTRAFAQAVHFAQLAWETEVSLFDSQWLDKPIALRGSSGDKGQIERFAIRGRLGRIIRTPSRALQFADEFAKHFFGMLEACAQGHRLAKAQGLKGEAFDDFVAMQVAVPGSPAWLAAVDKAHRITFTQDLPGPLQKAQNLLHERSKTPMGAVIKTFLRFVFPFVRTPYNIFATGLRKTPLGSARVGWKSGVGLVDAWQGKQAFFDSYPKAALAGDIAEQLIGWVTTLILAGMAEGDPDDDKKAWLITGTRSSSDSRGEAQLLNRTRGGETSILYRGKPVLNYGRIEPFATITSTLVDAMRELKRVQGGEPLTRAVENAARDLVDQARTKTFLQGFDGLVQLLHGQNKSIPDAVVKALVTGIVPNLVRQPLRNVDDYARDSRNAPWYYQALPFGGFAEPLYDLYGRAVEKGGSSLSRVLSANSNAKVQPRHPADTALVTWNKANEGDPQQQYYPVNPSVFRYKDPQGKWQNMTPAQIAAFRRSAGKAFATEAAANFASPKAPTREEMRGLRSVKEKTYDATKKAMFGTGYGPPDMKRRAPTIGELFGQKIYP